MEKGRRRGAHPHLWHCSQVCPRADPPRAHPLASQAPSPLSPPLRFARSVRCSKQHCHPGEFDSPPGCWEGLPQSSWEHCGAARTSDGTGRAAPASVMSPSPSPSPPPPPQPSLPSPTPPLPRAPPRLSLPSSSLHPPGQPLRRLRILPHAKARAAIASPKPMPEARGGATLRVRVCPHGARGPWVVPTRLAGTGFRLPVAVRAFACGLIWSPFRDCPGMSTGEAVGEARPEPPSTALPARRTPHRVSCVCGS